MNSQISFPVLSADEAASYINNSSTVALSGFTSAGVAKAIPQAIARKANDEHNKGNEYKIRVICGASTGDSVDTVLAEADALSERVGFQSSSALRNQINDETTDFMDIHISHIPTLARRGFLGKIDYAVIEATEITSDGRVYLTTAIGSSPAFLEYADNIIIEVNEYHSPRLREMTDIITLKNPPFQDAIPVHHSLSKNGVPYATVNPKKILGVVYTNIKDDTKPFKPFNAECEQIGDNVVEFLRQELKCGRIPKNFLPIQSGIGNVQNSIMAKLGQCPDIPPFSMYTEVLQDSNVDLIRSGKIFGASTCGLAITDDKLREIYSDMDFFSPKIILRPQEISNHPAVIRQLGVIAINTSLEADIYGNVNSTHICGTKMMNGIGGSGDFIRNAYLSIFVSPSITKKGKISNIVPMCTHIDSSEHSVQVLVTEQGVADLRGLSPKNRAKLIIENCVHPMYKDYIHSYVNNSPLGHIRHDIGKCFDLHQNLLKYGSMLPSFTG
ncbi:MAG: succinate CoA transferase [bacterium]|nr:succinate CoA transferase [bacterium]